MRLSHNLASLNVYRSYVKSLKGQSEAMEKISSGYKINKAGQNPNKIAQSERYRLEVRSLQMSSKNAQDGVSMLQTAEGGMQGITESLHRMRSLLVQAGGVNTKEDRDVIQKEINAMLDNIDTLSSNTEFNGVKLLGDNTVIDNEKPNFIESTVGSNIGETISIAKYNLSSAGLKLRDTTNSVNTEQVDNSLMLIDNAMDTVLSARSKYGAVENRFESACYNLQELSDRTQGAESGIRDADIAEEMMNVAKNGVLCEAGNAMMVQTNKFPQDILRILENVRSR